MVELQSSHPLAAYTSCGCLEFDKKKKRNPKETRRNRETNEKLKEKENLKDIASPNLWPYKMLERLAFS